MEKTAVDPARTVLKEASLSMSPLWVVSAVTMEGIGANNLKHLHSSLL